MHIIRMSSWRYIVALVWSERFGFQNMVKIFLVSLLVSYLVTSKDFLKFHCFADDHNRYNLFIPLLC